MSDGRVAAIALATASFTQRHKWYSVSLCKLRLACERRRGWAVEGSPADCVKLALAEFCPKPDLLVSGINGGLNVGINVLYSGAVARVTEGAVFGLTSVAVSLEYDEHAKFDQAADRLLNYVSERREMIRYPSFLANGWQIGSGPTESQCKLTMSRLKGRSQRWDRPNAAAVTALGSLERSGQWQMYWKTPSVTAA